MKNYSISVGGVVLHSYKTDSSGEVDDLISDLYNKYGIEAEKVEVFNTIQKGQNYLCISTFKVWDDIVREHKVAFRKGCIYQAERDGSLKNDFGRFYLAYNKDFYASNFIKIDKSLTVNSKDFTEWYFTDNIKTALGRNLADKLLKDGVITVRFSLSDTFYNTCESIPLKLISNLPKEFKLDELTNETLIPTKLVTLLE